MKRKYLDVVDEVEILKADLDAVSRDLERLANGQTAELHATFNKFGKTANLQLHDAPTNDGQGERPEERSTGLKFFKVPVIRQVSLLPVWDQKIKSFFPLGCCLFLCSDFC